MNRKLLITLAPLIVTAAFAVMPAASQAAPHMYVNGVIAAEGTHVPNIAWGTVELKNATLGELTCHTVWAGYLENPTGGGASVGRTQGFYPYECSEPLCTGTGGSPEFLPENLSASFPSGSPAGWVTEVTERKPKVFSLKTGHSKAKEAGNIELFWNCEPVTNTKYFGELSPKILNNGSTIGSKPGELQFEAEAGALESVNVGKLAWAGNIKLQGYEEEELISVKKP